MTRLERFARDGALDKFLEGDEEAALDLLCVAREIARPGVPAADHKPAQLVVVCAPAHGKNCTSAAAT